MAGMLFYLSIEFCNTEFRLKRFDAGETKAIGKFFTNVLLFPCSDGNAITLAIHDITHLAFKCAPATRAIFILMAAHNGLPV